MLRSTVGKTVLKVTAGTTVAYGTGVALALQNNTFNQVFTDNVPYAEEAVDFVESQLNSSKRDQIIANFKEKFSGSEKVVPVVKPPVATKGIDTIPESKPNADAQIEKPTVKAKPVPLVEANKSEKPIEPVKEVKKEIEIVKEFVKSEVELPLIELSVRDSSVKSLIDEFNNVIVKINKGVLTQDEKLSKISNVIQKFDADLSYLFETSKDQLDLAIKQKETDLLIEFSKKFDESIKLIEKRHELQLTEEVKIAKESLEKTLANQIKLNDIKARDEFTKLIARTVEEERDGKLAKFNELNQRVSQLAELVTTIDKHLDDSELKLNLQATLNKLKFKLNSNKVENLKPEVDELFKLAESSKNELVLSALKAIDKSIIQQGLLTQSQLISRFNLLVPELRTTAILPPNAGVLGHLSAKFFSYLFISKKGHVEGKDIESIISRVENYLIANELDNAVEEIANLKGWSRKLADDWLVESRKRLEMEFLVNLIDLESRTLY